MCALVMVALAAGGAIVLGLLLILGIKLLAFVEEVLGEERHEG